MDGLIPKLPLRRVSRGMLAGLLLLTEPLAAGERVVMDQKSAGREVKLYVGGSVARKSFRFSSGEGWLDAEGSFQMKTDVRHRKLLCARYRMAVQFGVGESGCRSVEWLGKMHRLTNRQQCNGVTLTHSGGDRLEPLANHYNVVSCARLQVICSGDFCR